jgi:hypothetical protein
VDDFVSTHLNDQHTKLKLNIPVTGHTRLAQNLLSKVFYRGNRLFLSLLISSATKAVESMVANTWDIQEKDQHDY